MNILITGADGFVGRALVERLATDPPFSDPGNSLTLLAPNFETPPADPRARMVRGSITDPAVLEDALADKPDLVFHLACISSAQAEADFQLGLDVNVRGTLALFEGLRKLGTQPHMVFTSSIAVYGSPLPERVDEATVAAPTLSYGAEKLVGETLLRDYVRRGWFTGHAVRLPGIVARPPIKTGAGSAFLGDLMRVLAAGERYTIPVSPEARTWLMSRPCCVDNLLHAADMRETGGACIWTLPAQHVVIGRVVDALAAVYGDHVHRNVSYDPDPYLEQVFGSYPPLITPNAEAAGFRHDGDLETLVTRALEGIVETE